MLQNNFELRVLVKGRPITEYAHNGQVFIEGRDGSNFELEFKNLTPNRVEAVISVDGLSIIDGKEAGPQSSGYLVNAYETVRIPGWKLTDEQVASFVFAGKKNSYATQMTGSARNNGVIGVLVFSEKHKPQVFHTFGGGGFRGIVPQPYYGSAGGIVKGMAAGSAGGWADMGGSAGDPIIGASLSNNMSYTAASASLDSAAATSLTSDSLRARTRSAAPPVEQTLGTGFGKAQEFETTTVSFDRGDLALMMVLYYDDSRGLKARGIQLTRPSKAKLTQQPQAFPGMNCAPPPGWKG